MAELGIVISADIQRAVAGLRKVKAELANTGKAAESSASKINKVSRVASGTATKGMGDLKKSTAGASNTLLEFNRVVQDAPFGIRGVANNIQQLVANFGYLSQQSGGSSAALKAMASAFIGPAGILFAVSAITSLLTVYGDKLFKTTSLTKELTKATTDFAAGAIKEISVLRQLLVIAGDETQSRDKRNQAVQVLQDKYPEYLKNLNEENTTTKEIKQSVDALTKSLEVRAKVQGAEALIAEKAKDLFNAQTKAQEDFEKQIKDIPRRLADQATAYRQYAKGVGGAQFDLQKNEARLQEIAQDRLKGNLSEAEEEYQKYVQRLASILGNAPNLLDAFGITTEGAGTDKSRKLFEGFIPANLGEIFAVTKGIGPALVEPITLAARQTKPQLDLIAQGLREFNQEANALIQGSIGNTFSFLGEAIGAGLASGESVFNAIGKGLLGAMGNFLSSMGDLLIKYGTLAIAKGKIDAAIAAGGPIAIGAGLAAIAVGVAVKAAGAAISRTATKGFGSGFGTGAVAGQGGFSSVGGGNFGASGTGTQTVVFEIAGTKLLGVLKNTQERNLRLGGSQLAL